MPALEGLYVNLERVGAGSRSAYLLALAAVAIAVGLPLAFPYWLAAMPFSLLYLAVMATTFVSGTAAGAFSVGLATLAGWFLFISPRFPFEIHNALDVSRLIGFVVVGTIQMLAVAAMRAAILGFRQLTESLDRQVAERTAALRDGERRFQDIAEVSGDWMWETDCQHRFTLLLAESTETTSLQRETLIGRTRWEVAGADPVTDEPWVHHKAQLDAHEPFRYFRHQVDAPGGSQMHVSVSGKPVFDEAHEFVGYRGTATDETATVEARRRAEVAEALLRRVFETSLDLIVVTDRRGTLLRISPSAMPLLGYNPDELVGRSGVDLVYSEDLDATRNEMRIARRSGTTQNFECRYVHKQGHNVTLWWKGVWSASEQQHFFIGRDITDRKETERRLRHSEEQLKRAQRLANMGSIHVNLQTGETDWSDEIYQIFGLSRDIFIPSKENYLPMVHPDDRATVSAIQEQVRQGINPQPMEYRIVRPDGPVRQIYRESEMIWDEAGNPLYVHSTLQDITERRQTQEQLRQAQKMEAIGNLTGGMAHDFNNLLGVIIGNLDLLRDTHSGDPDVDELSGEALDAALRGADLTRRLLAFARRQPLQPTLADVNELIAGIVKLLQRTLGEQIRITLDLDPDAWPVVVDPAQLEASLTNLATNARDAMPGGGQLTFSTGNRFLDADYASQHAEVQVGDYAMIEVSDTGTGMPPEIASRIFEPFYTTKEQGKGTGLGLSMVFGFIKQSGGHINLYSEVGIGTTFRLYLRRADTDAEASGVVLPTALVRGRGETVLAVEDNASLRRVVARQLTELGYRVLEAEDAQTALRILENEPVDLLFTDIVMPGGASGYEIAGRVLSRWPQIKVVLTSGFPENRAKGDPNARGLRLLSKPYRRNDLGRLIREVLDS